MARHRPPSDDPVLRALAAAPLDDEPVTEEEQRAVAGADEDLRRGDVIGTPALRRRLGLEPPTAATFGE